MGSAPYVRKLLRTASDLRTLTTALLISATIASGVSGGATSLNHVTEVKPGNAASDTVGTSGRWGERSGVHTARILSVPAWCCGNDDDRLSNMNRMWPPSRSFIAG